MLSKQLTKNQWNELLSDLVCHFDDDDDISTKKQKLTRKHFVKDWCMQHGIPKDAIPHTCLLPAYCTSKMIMQSTMKVQM